MKGTTKRARRSERILRADVKACGLCGTLNLRSSAECFICGWHGAFRDDAHTVEAAWRCLEAEYGCIQREHVSGANAPLLHGFEIANGAVDTGPRLTWHSRLTDWITLNFGRVGGRLQRRPRLARRR